MEKQREKLTIKSWAEKDRPREKLRSNGSSFLSDAELIAILIGTGNRDETAVELSRRILSSANNNLNELGKMGIRDLMKFNGIGEAKAITIASALELGRRRKDTESLQKLKFTCSRDIFKLFEPKLADLPHEEFWILLLNRANKEIDTHCISSGGISGTVTDSRMIFKIAIEQRASSIVLIHNHPSGNITPSSSDIELTERIKEAGKLMEIQVLDHIIISDKKYYSFADENII